MNSLAYPNDPSSVIRQTGWSIDTHSPNMIVGDPSCSSDLCFVPIIIAEPDNVSFVLRLDIPTETPNTEDFISLKEHYAFLDLFKVDDDFIRFTKITTHDGISFLKPTTSNGNYLIINKLLNQPDITFYKITSMTSWLIDSEGFASQYKLLLAFKELYNNAI